MTTNQTIDGMPRELALRLLLGNGSSLRALLDAPACKTCNGTRIVSDGAMYCSSGGSPFESGPIECVKDCPDCKPAAQPQAEPVALLSKGFTTLETGDGKYRIITQYKNRDDAWSDYTELCRAEQPAPVAVASRDESIYWLKRIDGIGQARAELIYSMGFRRHTEVPQS